jgi:hypothetical protein
MRACCHVATEFTTESRPRRAINVTRPTGGGRGLERHGGACRKGIRARHSPLHPQPAPHHDTDTKSCEGSVLTVTCSASTPLAWKDPMTSGRSCVGLNVRINCTQSSAPTSPVGTWTCHAGGWFQGIHTRRSFVEKSFSKTVPSQALLSTVAAQTAPMSGARCDCSSQERSAVVTDDARQSGGCGNVALWHPAVLKQPTANATPAATWDLTMPHPVR